MDLRAEVEQELAAIRSRMTFRSIPGLHYILDGTEPLAVDFATYTLWWTQQMGVYVRVAQTMLGEERFKVSTVFLGINRNHTEGPPLVFESMLFRWAEDEEGEWDYQPDEDLQWQYSTWTEAELGHEAMVLMTEFEEQVKRDPPKGANMIGISILIERDGETIEMDASEATEEELIAWAATQTPEGAAAFFGAVCSLYSQWMKGANTEEVVEVAQDGTLVQHKSMPLPSFTKEPGTVIKAVRLWPTSDNRLWQTENQAKQHEIAIKART